MAGQSGNGPAAAHAITTKPAHTNGALNLERRNERELNVPCIISSRVERYFEIVQTTGN